MKIILNNQVKEALEKVLTKINIEGYKLNEILECFDKGETPVLEKFKVEILEESKLVINGDGDIVLKIVKLEEETVIYIHDGFVIDTINLYGDIFTEIFNSLGGMFKSMFFLFHSKVEPYLKKWRTTGEIKGELKENK